MKKRILSVAAATVLTMSMGITAFADTESDLLAHYDFNDNMKNSVNDTEATITGKAFAAAAGNTFEYVDGALHMAQGNTDGLNLNVKAEDNTYTFSVWATTNIMNGFAEPIMWYGGKDQTVQAWVGLWPGLNAVWTEGGPVVGSCNAAGERPAVLNGGKNVLVEETEDSFKWTMFTVTVEDGVGTLYYNGEQVGQTGEAELKLEAVTADDRSFYLGVNAWDAPFAGLVDEVYIYDRVLTADDVKELYEATKSVADQEMLKFNVPEYPTPAISSGDEFLETQATDAAAEDEGGMDTMTIAIIAVVAVVVVVVVVAAVMASKKKKNTDN